MNVYLFSAVVLLLPALCTALGAAGVFLVRRADELRTRRMLCGMAAGIMLAASVWSLLLPAIERAEAGPLPVWLAPAAGLVLGAVGLLRLEEAAGRLMHGKASPVRLDTASPLFRGLPAVIPAARYHSLAVKRETLPPELLVAAETEDGEVMAVTHRDFPVCGLQFHPESILTPNGREIVANFLNMAEAKSGL